MRYILEFDDRFIMVIVNKVTMVRKPANPKYHNDNQKHLHYLEIVLQKSLILKSTTFVQDISTSSLKYNSL